MTSPTYGIFARVFPRGPAISLAGSIRASGYSLAQLNLSALGLPTIPRREQWALVDADKIRCEFGDAGVALWGLSCSYNMIHPNSAKRREDTLSAVELISRAPEFGVTAVTLCTGSRNMDSMWLPHTDNASGEAWSDLRTELDLLLAAASEAGVLLGVEPEPGNVVRDAAAATRLLTELGEDAQLIGIIADSANLLSAEPRETHPAVLTQAIEQLAPNIACLHAKDLVSWEQTLAGDGVVDYQLVASLYDRLPQRPPVIVQDARAEDAGRVLEFLRSRFR